MCELLAYDDLFSCWWIQCWNTPPPLFSHSFFFSTGELVKHDGPVYTLSSLHLALFPLPVFVAIFLLLNWFLMDSRPWFDLALVFSCILVSFYVFTLWRPSPRALSCVVCTVSNRSMTGRRDNLLMDGYLFSFLYFSPVVYCHAQVPTRRLCNNGAVGRSKRVTMSPVKLCMLLQSKPCFFVSGFWEVDCTSNVCTLAFLCCCSATPYLSSHCNMYPVTFDIWQWCRQLPTQQTI